MNDGNICISVCARTIDELFEQVKRAEELADVVEIRFDCLDENVLFKALQDLPRLDNLLITFRIKSEGGKREITLADRLEFWKKFHYYNQNQDYFVDLEADNLSFENFLGGKKILSAHYFQQVPDDLLMLYSALSGLTKTSIIKIAVQTNDITDSIKIWQLLKKAKSENREIIPIAMGESGKWTRILGLAHGAFMTYAALDSDKETAPGQVTARELIELYRVKELDETTDVYGILGDNTGVSLSPPIHNTAFKFHRLNSVFVPFQVHDLDEFIKRMVNPGTREIELNFKGFAVTIPHKENIIHHLDYIDETAEKIGAVNTVKIADGKMQGFNTDAKGFITPLKKTYGNLENAKVAILGSGGSAKACQYALAGEKADVKLFTGAEIRSSDFKNRSFSEFDILVNTTPIGMKGKFEGQSPVLSEQLNGLELVYDLVYVPTETELIKQASQLNIATLGGIEMLLAQAAEQQRIWTGLEAPDERIRQIVLSRL